MQDTQNPDIESLLLAPPQHMPQIVSQSKKSKNKFLRGPINWSWLKAAARLPGSALHVAVAIHFQNGFEQTGMVKLSPTVWRDLGLKRHTVYRAIDELEDAGLVSVERKRGCGPIITLCEPNAI